MIKSKTLIMIPVYNAEEFIEKTLKSCLKQTLRTEIWVVDNCSTDKTQMIVKNHEKEDTRVKLIVNNKNYGRTGNWNRCLDIFMDSEYEYIKYVFSGDEIMPQCIEESEKAFNIDDDIGAIAFPYEFIDLNGKVTIPRHEKYSNTLLNSKDITRINLSEGMLLGAIICNVYAKKAINKYRFDENSISKARFDIQVLENSKAYYLDKVLAKFNLDAHRTFNEADSPYGYLEFSFIEIKEHNRISKTDKFTKLENENMEQKIILNCIKHQLRFMKYKTLIVVIYNIFKVITKNIIKRIVYGK
jgi:glycosyltransferase involved in cell wall biosynthesis